MLRGAFATSGTEAVSASERPWAYGRDESAPAPTPISRPCRRLLEQDRVTPPQQNTPVTSGPPGLSTEVLGKKGGFVLAKLVPRTAPE